MKKKIGRRRNVRERCDNDDEQRQEEVNSKRSMTVICIESQYNKKKPLFSEK